VNAPHAPRAAGRNRSGFPFTLISPFGSASRAALLLLGRGCSHSSARAAGCCRSSVAQQFLVAAATPALAVSWLLPVPARASACLGRLLVVCCSAARAIVLSYASSVRLEVFGRGGLVRLIATARSWACTQESSAACPRDARAWGVRWSLGCGGARWVDGRLEASAHLDGLAVEGGLCYFA
jgi:hypothetical protein